MQFAYELGLAFFHGLHGKSKDRVEAARLYRLAAEQGHSGAQYELGYMHRYGAGVPKDAAEAVRFYRIAAEQGHVEAMMELSLCDEQGWGEKDLRESVGWFRQPGCQRVNANHQLPLVVEATNTANTAKHTT